MRSGLRQLKVKIRDKKEVYRRKLENKVQQNIRDVWSGMKKIMGFKQKEDRMDLSLDRSDKLKSFFNRFSSETSSSPDPDKQKSHPPLAHSFPVTSQLSHFPPQSWILLLLQPHLEIWGPLHLPSSSKSPCINKQALSRTHCTLLIVVGFIVTGLELKMIFPLYLVQ